MFTPVINILPVYDAFGRAKRDTEFLKILTTVPIPTDDGNICCDACGCKLEAGQTFCPSCRRGIDWSK